MSIFVRACQLLYEWRVRRNDPEYLDSMRRLTNAQRVAAASIDHHYNHRREGVRMNHDEFKQEVDKFLESQEFKDSGAFDEDGNVDFGPASVAVSDFIEQLEGDADEAEDELTDAEGNDLEGSDPNKVAE